MFSLSFEWGIVEETWLGAGLIPFVHVYIFVVPEELGEGGVFFGKAGEVMIFPRYCTWIRQ